MLIEKEGNIIIVKQVFQANLEDDYCSKLCHLLKIGFWAKHIDPCHFFHLLVHLKNYVR